MRKHDERRLRNEKILALYEAGKPIREIAIEVKLSESSVRRIIDWQPLAGVRKTGVPK